MSFLDAATRYLFFADKGGVDKTSIACAAAVTLADRGQRVLLVSTDPASNLDAVLGVSLSSQPNPSGRNVCDASRRAQLPLDSQRTARREVRDERIILPAGQEIGIREFSP